MNLREFVNRLFWIRRIDAETAAAFEPAPEPMPESSESTAAQSRAEYWAAMIAGCTNDADADRLRDLCRMEAGLPTLFTPQGSDRCAPFFRDDGRNFEPVVMGLDFGAGGDLTSERIQVGDKGYFVVRDDDLFKPDLTDWPQELQALTFTVCQTIPGEAPGHMIDCTTLDGGHAFLPSYPTEASAPLSDANHARENTTEGTTMNTPAAGGKKAAKPPVMRDYYSRDKLTGKERIISAPSLADANRFATRDMIEVRLLSTADAMRLAGQGIGPEVATDPAQEALPLADNANGIDPTRIESGSLSLDAGQDGAAGADDPT